MHDEHIRIDGVIIGCNMFERTRHSGTRTLHFTLKCEDCNVHSDCECNGKMVCYFEGNKKCQYQFYVPEEDIICCNRLDVMTWDCNPDKCPYWRGAID